MKTAIMTDTNSGLSVAEGSEQGLFVLPMPVSIDGEDYLEGENITNSELYAALRLGRNVHSSQPSPGAVMGMWDDILNQGYDELIYIPMSSGLSGSCEMAKQFAQQYGERVRVADNRRISVTLYEAVLEARRMVDGGANAAEAQRMLEAHAADSSIYISVDSLEYLKRSGRVTAAAAAFAAALNLKPVLTIQGGKLDAFAKARGMKNAQKRILEAAEDDVYRRFGDFPTDRIALGAAGTFERQEDADYWLDRLKQAFPGYRVYYQPLSCSIACHVGIDAIGLGISCLSV